MKRLKIITHYHTRGFSSTYTTLPCPYITNIEPCTEEAEPFDANLVTRWNWDGLMVYRPTRKSKEVVWANRMYFREGFTLTINGQKKIGKYGHWLILNANNKKSIMTNRMFRKKFRKM